MLRACYKAESVLRQHKIMKKFMQNLAALRAQNRYRSLNLPRGIDLTSNDYLGMRGHPGLRRAAITAIEDGMDLGSGGSRLLRGHTRYHQALEDFAAGYFFAEKTLYFATGYQANMALFTTLPDRHDTVIFDEFIHASARDGIRSAHARHIKVRHNDLNAYEDALKSARQKDGAIWIAVESLYSMDGDFAPLGELYALARKYDAMLIVDEAHASGVWGPGGRGLVAGLSSPMPENLITLHTCGKAIGVAGGLICASSDIIDTLINRARPFIFSTAPPPLQAFLVQKSLEILGSQEGDERRKALNKNLHYVNSKDFIKGRFSGAESQIVPIIFGPDANTLAAAQSLQNAGFDIRAIRPPTVPEGTSRLRLSLSSELDAQTLDDFAAHLEPLLEEREAA